jgi:hypothetical protein
MKETCHVRERTSNLATRPQPPIQEAKGKSGGEFLFRFQRRAEIGYVAAIDLRHGENHKNIRRAELPIDENALAEPGAKTQIAFDERWNGQARIGVAIAAGVADFADWAVDARHRGYAPFSCRQGPFVYSGQNIAV